MPFSSVSVATFLESTHLRAQVADAIYFSRAA
jgi:hypothetical protein